MFFLLRVSISCNGSYIMGQYVVLTTKGSISLKNPTKRVDKRGSLWNSGTSIGTPKIWGGVFLPWKSTLITCGFENYRNFLFKKWSISKWCIAVMSHRLHNADSQVHTLATTFYIHISVFDDLWQFIQIRQHLAGSRDNPLTPCCKLLTEVNTVVWKAKLTKLTEKGSYFSDANCPVIICKLGLRSKVDRTDPSFIMISCSCLSSSHMSPSSTKPG
jgi:hypothetical protein